MLVSTYWHRIQYWMSQLLLWQMPSIHYTFQPQVLRTRNLLCDQTVLYTCKDAICRYTIHMNNLSTVGTEHCATWRRWRRREWSDARSVGRDGRGGEGIGRDARTGDGWGEDGENWGEGREEKERGCAPRVEGHERATGVELFNEQFVSFPQKRTRWNAS